MKLHQQMWTLYTCKTCHIFCFESGFRKRCCVIGGVGDGVVWCGGVGVLVVYGVVGCI